jgi:hypothetical protein
MAKGSFLEQLQNGLADGIADIREKLVEEPWFGRAVTERAEPTPEAEAEVVPGWGSKVRQAEIAPPEPEQDREMER